MTNLLLVEPEFPVASKSKNHASFLPIGLLKIGSYHKQLGHKIQLVRGAVNKTNINIKPNKIYITSLFTYWSRFVRDSVYHYRNLFPRTEIIVGGIFASLMPKECKDITGCDEVKIGLYEEGNIEHSSIDYSILETPINYQIIHASRGCFRKCSFCGTWKIEPHISFKKSIANEIQSNHLIFYDNNLLANPFLENILEELQQSKYNKRIVYSECQSGLDGRILQKMPNIAESLRKAHFLNPRIAWDGSVIQKDKIKLQIDILKKSGYKAGRHDADVYIFMLFNHNQSYTELMEKLEYCRRWGVLVIDCRFRPLNLLEDSYNPRAKFQPEGTYYIHKGWTDRQVRAFRRNVRRQNIAIRLGLPRNKYIDGVEDKYLRLK